MMAYKTKNPKRRKTSGSYFGTLQKINTFENEEERDFYRKKK
jgi:hypothetical protein